MKRFFSALAHLLIISSLSVIVFKILDWYNPYMNFLGLGASSILLLVFCILSLVESIRMLFLERQPPGETRQKHRNRPASLTK